MENGRDVAWDAPVSKRTLAVLNLLTSKSYPKHIWSSTNLNISLGKMLGSVS